METQNDKIREFQTLQTHVECPAQKLRVLNRAIDYRKGQCGQSLDGTTYRPTYGSSADAAYLTLERRAHRARMGD